jgi:TetR/AcrR family transcriptional regulator, cholesterol catabolism regulator
VPHTPRTITRQPPRTPQAGPRSKRDQILDVATDYFGRYGYDETKWADVAAAVGIGSTALYHYFESKQHCLYEIMSRAVVRTRDRFDHIVAANTDWRTALVELLESGFELAAKDVHEYRVLLSQHERLEARRSAPREEAARKSVRARKRELEAAWAAFLARGIEEGQLSRSDPQLLARSLLGLYNSVWTWYRPGGALSIEEVGRFFVRRELALLGCD